MSPTSKPTDITLFDLFFRPFRSRGLHIHAHCCDTSHAIIAVFSFFQ